jgi:CheY-like chemotaxis protein
MERLEGLRVLVAEDNEVNRILIRKILEKSGCTVALAVNGVEAVEMIREHTFDAVLMDVQMPELDGLAATRIIRAAGMTGLPIIALTAHAFQHDVQECLAAGMNAYLSKPVHAQTLRAALAEASGWRTPATARSTS